MNIFRKNDGWPEKPSGSNWKKVLNKLYNYAPKHFDSMQQIADELKISINEITSAIEFLETQDLIKIDGKKNTYYIITEKGFSVALQNELKLQEMQTQSLVTMLSMVIVF